MGIDQYVRKVMNPFTRKEFERVAFEEICPPTAWNNGAYVRLRPQPLEEALADTRGCRVGGRPVPSDREAFCAMLDFAALAPVHGGAVSLPGDGFALLFVDAQDGPSLAWSAEAPDVGPPARGRRLRPELCLDQKAEEHFEGYVEDALLTHRVGWGRAPQGLDWSFHAIALELREEGLGTGPAELRDAEGRGVDVVAIIRRALSWTLLWEVATDDDVGVDWGDGSRLLVFIRNEDLSARRFERAVVEVAPFS